jgi:hypothetical protein
VGHSPGPRPNRPGARPIGLSVAAGGAAARSWIAGPPRPGLTRKLNGDGGVGLSQAQDGIPHWQV